MCAHARVSVFDGEHRGSGQRQRLARSGHMWRVVAMYMGTVYQWPHLWSAEGLRAVATCGQLWPCIGTVYQWPHQQRDCVPVPTPAECRHQALLFIRPNQTSSPSATSGQQMLSCRCQLWPCQVRHQPSGFAVAQNGSTLCSSGLCAACVVTISGYPRQVKQAALTRRSERRGPPER